MDDTSTRAASAAPDRSATEDATDPGEGAAGGHDDGGVTTNVDADEVAPESDARTAAADAPHDADGDDSDDAGSSDGADRDGSGDAPDDLDALRERVDAEYDFDDFGPADMARMTAEEWTAAFDPETWITGGRLLDRVEAELKSRIARREVFGLLERVREDGEERVLVYSDEGYAIVRPTGEVSGRGTVLRDVEPLVAMAAMEEYEVPEPPADWSLPHPESVPEGSGEFGNLMIQVIAAVQVIAGAVLLGASFFFDLESIIGPAMGIVFLLVGGFLFAMVANARLSDRFRSAEYRDRLRALREAEERPEFVPVDEAALTDARDDQ